MTRRERLERKLERRQEWADSRRDKANAVLNNRPSYASDWAFITQPGHIPARARLIAREDKAYENLNMAQHHEQKAAGLADQLDRAIFSDDPDATSALEQRIAENEAKRDRMKQINALYRKNDAAGLLALGINLDSLKEKLAAAGSYWGSAPHLPYELTNLGARIRDDKKRLDQVKEQQERSALRELAKTLKRWEDYALLRDGVEKS